MNGSTELWLAAFTLGTLAWAGWTGVDSAGEWIVFAGLAGCAAVSAIDWVFEGRD